MIENGRKKERIRREVDAEKDEMGGGNRVDGIKRRNGEGRECEKGEGRAVTKL